MSLRTRGRTRTGTRPTDHGRPTRTVAALAVPVVAATLAVIHPGTPEAQVDLHDGAVWLTNTSERMLGRYNAQIDELNAALVAETDEFDVRQDEGDVLLVEPGTLTVVDPAHVVAAGETALPSAADVGMAAGVVAVAERTGGGVWVRPIERVAELDVSVDVPDLDVGPGGVAVVARTGTVLAARTDGTVLRATVPTGADGADDAAPTVTVTEAGTLAGGPTAGHDQATAVGEVLVTLGGGVLRTPDRSVTLPGEDHVLQQPGPTSDVVLVATATGLLEVPLAGGDVVEHASGGSGRPAAPVRVGACAHAAWATATGSYLQLCGDGDADVRDLAGMTTSDRLVFRVNRDVVVLNDTLRGRLWLPLEDTRLREPDWTLVEPQEETQDEENESEDRERTQDVRTECTPESAAPSAVDDEVGVRAGRTVILPVIDNDSSSECGILAISEFDPLPESFGTLTSVYGGRALQLEVAPGASGTQETTYTITDGRGATAPSTATVRITVRPDGVNAAPEQLRTGSFSVEQGASTTYDVLADFRDPDGDPLLLRSATVDAGGSVRTRLDGQLTFTSDGSALGRQTVRVLVSDGRETVEGQVFVDVRPTGSLPPVIDPVLASTYVDQPVVVRPLSSVRSVSREPVRLAEVQQVTGATVEADLSAGRFTFTAPSPGTYYVTFTVTATPQQATGLARIDVREPPETTPPPVAVRDVALLPSGGEVTIAPLENDEDPAGGVLVLQSVETPASTGLEVAVLRHELVRITSVRTLEEPVVVRYTVSNGGSAAQGEILVIPVTSDTQGQPPVVPDARATVRTGGVVTVPVLERAYDPDGDPLTLLPDLVEPPSSGLMFASGDVIRFRAPDVPGRVRATFAVEDPVGNRVAANVTIDVHESDPETKSPPRPRNLTARVFQGQTVRIEVPLVGIDDDGDGVLLLGEASAGLLGRVVDRGPDWLEYEAYGDSLGTDTFTYAVEDWVGQRATATVRVGISPRPTTAAQVVSRDDEVQVRPGRTVEVRVLANDVDTSGGELELDPELDLAEGVDATTEGRRVVVRAPEEEAVLQIGYTARNERGGQDGAVLTVVVSPDAPILPPIAEDVVVPATDTINRTSVEVDVLSLAVNPSGPLSDLAVSVHPSAAEVASVLPSGRVLVQLGPTPQTVPYLLTNTDPEAEGRSTYAFISVPALGDFPPVRRPRAAELQVVSGEELLIPLAEQVQVAPGREPRIDDPSSVSATRSDGSALSTNETTLRFVSQPGYAGPASISFEVTDRTAGDATPRSSFLTLPITVLAVEENPPRFVPSTLELGPGDTVRVDLRRFTTSPTGQEGEVAGYRYSLVTDPPTGVTARLEGSELALTAATSVPRGTVGGVGVRIGYGAGGTLDTQVDFRVTASLRRLARVVDREVPGVQGVAQTVQVLDDASNPFPGEPLSLVSAVVETAGAGTAEVTGSALTVRPDDGFVGRMVTRFTVQDATGDPDRRVEARLTVEVRGRPEAPTAPRVVEVGDRSVVLAWDAPADNSSPITGYRLSGGGRTITCPGTTCTVTELTNDVEYRFTVTAVNEVGESPASPASAPVRPDARPAAPAAPSLEWRDGAVRAVWSAPENPGSPIVRYDVEISPSAPGGASTSTTSTSHTFSGLTNGTAYQVRVRAVNSAPEPGDWSALSASAVPAGPPRAPVVTGNAEGDVFGSAAIRLTWTAAEPNGDPVSAYQVQVDGGNVVDVGTSREYLLRDVATRPYEFRVRARNKADWGAWSSTVRVSPSTRPDRVRLTGAVQDPATGPVAPGGGVVVLAFEAPDSGGSSIERYEVSINGREWDELEGRRVAIETVGSYSFAVRACNANGCGDASETRSGVVVTTLPTSPQVDRPTVTRDSSEHAPGPAVSYTFRWSPSADEGGLTTRYTVRHRIAGATWQEREFTSPTQTDLVITAAISEDASKSGGVIEVEVVATNSRGSARVTSSVSFDAFTPPPPPDPEPEPEPEPEEPPGNEDDGDEETDP